MKKLKLIAIIATLFVLIMSSPAFAIGIFDIEQGEDIPSQNILRQTNRDGSLYAITYVISSTGATSGIRYRTSAITVDIGGQTASIDISSLGGTPAGVHQFTQITITREDIKAALPGLSDTAFNNPENIRIGANIQIYNAGSGEVLATITKKSDVSHIAGSIGFGSQDIRDMESRFLGESRPPVVLPPEPDESGLRPGELGYGLRPSILVK